MPEIEPDHVHELLERIARYSRRALTLADDFVQLARAESQTYVLEPVSLSELTIDASDEVWPQAHAKQIQLETASRGRRRLLDLRRPLADDACARQHSEQRSQIQPA